ncbi:DUF262 domain-containing protein [Metamycoplasma hyosynoviae]|uniref:DUF262 domain-containing protein n=4 Tax=Metamycoplasma hyosynoviae TaxID=29559 RepID=UPI00235A1FF7|nr:DUF262 domain-containing protein [Metamycoplasma hyosynoviae]MDC8915788.1 DUF262 domain-containing protein [Metamycoplasma hyosynoviae]MDC8920310.1 DUF262 domain-containing protein [Metamycoplasma hyosynoviae]
MNEKIKKLFENKCIKYWKIRTNFDSYYASILDWIRDKSFLTKVKNIKIVLSHNSDKTVTAKFDLLSNKKVYLSKAEQNCVYSESTINQFIHVLEYLNILNECKSNEYKFTYHFENFTKSVINESNSLEDKLDNFISNLVNKLLSEFINEVKNLSEENENNKKQNSIINFSFSIWYNGFCEKQNINESFSYLIDEFKTLYDLTLEDRSFKKLGILADDEIIKSIAREINDYLGLNTKTIEEILKNKKIKFQTNNKYIQPSPENGKKQFSKITSVEDFFYDYISFTIPIFQRAYVWNKNAIEMMIQSMILDMNDGKETYLNNIITLDNEIIDGQQRLFTLTLILYSIMKILAYEEKLVPKLFEKLFSSYSKDNNSLKYFFIENANEIQVYEEFEQILNEWNGNLGVGKLLINIVRFIETKNIDIDKFKEQILTKTKFTHTNLTNKNPDKIFANLNTIQRTLSSLDLVRNWIYSECKRELKENSHFQESQEKEKTIQEVIKYFNINISDKFKKNNSTKIEDKKLLELFIDNLFLKLNIPWNKQSDINKDILYAQKLNFIFENLIFSKEVNEEENIEELKIYKALKKLHIYLNEFLYVICKFENINKDYLEMMEITKLYAFNAAINATQSSKKTVVIPLTWAICDKFKILDKDFKPNITKNYNDIFETSKWLFEIERFIIYWKEVYFKGQSLSQKLFAIAKKIRTFKDYSINNFRNELLESIIEISSPKERNEKLKNALLDRYKDRPKNAIDDIKHFLIRINFYLLNNKNIYLDYDRNDTPWLYLNNFFDPTTKLEVEHHNPQTPKKEDLDKLINYNKDKYDKCIQKIGNLTLLDKKSNIRNNNNMGNEKQSENPMCKITSGDVKGPLLPLKNSLPNDWNDISQHIDKRSDQLIDIICEIYKYEENIE